ncbi:hypothetical protein BBK36DRAFT_1169654 [Trichoderma citrinoviride]|uniref:Uncharacterized protein n=1 Tax=Trichoderma citrinoviride TaxID=58853 RepID=A0A2T4B9H1_9HYPO|nr:hypothetical protein BBK36DRAFT_1169654 [Trichoderma citrinoviride]PTB65974.1 hypothetical protein BBK36DRAFT_1169654 [Trichoderma citrinoviride]
MSTLPPATEVAMDLDDSPGLMIRLRGPTADSGTTRDSTAGTTLQLELLDRVEGILERIGKALSCNFDKLPAQAQQLGAPGRPGDLLQRLNTLVEDRVLDGFFEEHAVCRRHFSQLFGCRYPHLRETESEEAIGGAIHREAAASSSVPVEGLQAALDERLQSRFSTIGGVSWQPVVKGASSPNPTSKDALSEAIDAFDGFDPLYSDSARFWAPAWSLSLPELEFIEKLYRYMDTLLGEESIGSLLHEMPNMAPQLKEAFARRFAHLSDMSQRCQGAFQNKVFAEMPVRTGIELEMTIGPDESTDADEGKPESSSIAPEPMSDTDKRPGAAAVVASNDLRLQNYYKGWLIADPRVQLARAKNFLADGDIDRTPGWERKFAELAEYCAYLRSKHQGEEDWTRDLREALDMLRAHWIFETYHYGAPQLVVDFPTGFWPKRSTRLPQLPGPEIELRPRDRVTGPVMEGSAEDASSHDVSGRASSSSSSLAHPHPSASSKKPDAGIIYAMKRLAHPPEKESRDPWAYTRAYQFYKHEELRWAQWTREHAIKESYGHKLWMGSDEPVMELPKNYKGPVQPDLMNLEMKKTYELLRRCQKIHQGLKRAAKRAPRGFIVDLLTAVSKGVAGSSIDKTSLRFGEHEFDDADDDGVMTLANVRPTEAAWLEYICQPSRNRPHALKEGEAPLGKRGELLLSRVTQMMRDMSPVSLFSDMKPRTMEHFLKELNVGCRGPVKRHEFTEREVRVLAPKLHHLKVLKNLTNGELMFGRPETEFHPEDLVKWPEAEPQTSSLVTKQQFTSYTSRTRPESKGKEKMRDDIDDDDASVASIDTISTKVSVPASSEDFHVYPPDMPQRKDVLSLHEFIKEEEEGGPATMLRRRRRSPEWRDKTANFFFCLGYRLGKTLTALQKQHAEDERKLQQQQDAGVREHNSSFLDAILQYWEDDTKKRPNDRDKNKAKTRDWRITMTWADVVKMADPEAYERHREEWADKEYPSDGVAYDLVRRNLVREAAENKTMLWPLHLPYNSYVTRYRVADPTPWRDRFREESDEIWRDAANWDARGARIEALRVRLREEQAEDEKKQDALAAEAQNLTTMRREPVWTFAHPSRKKAVHLFWDINNWPVHLQSESRQRAIASRGPEKRTSAAAADNNSNNNNNNSNDLFATFAEELEQDAEMPYWKVAERKRRFVPGREGFWMGDTPLQRRVFEERMKMRLAPPARKRTWGDVLKAAAFGSSSSNNNEPAAASGGGVSHRFALPAVPEHLIPESRPAKRQRAEGSPLHKKLLLLGEEQKPDLFAIARGETGVPPKPVVPVEYRGTYSKAGQITYRVPDAKAQRKGGGGSLMNGQGAVVEYLIPVKRG